MVFSLPLRASSILVSTPFQNQATRSDEILTVGWFGDRCTNILELRLW